MIRVVAMDLAGNTSTREFNLATLPAANTPGIATAAATMPAVNTPAINTQTANVPPVTTHRNTPNILPQDLASDRISIRAARPAVDTAAAATGGLEPSENANARGL